MSCRDLVTRKSAHWVTGALNHFVEEQLTGNHFELVVFDGDGVDEELLVRALLFQDFALDIHLPTFDLHTALPATVALGEASS